MGCPWGIFERPWALWGHPLGAVGLSLRLLGKPLGLLLSSLSVLRQPLGRPGGSLGALWGILGASVNALGTSSATCPLYFGRPLESLAPAEQTCEYIEREARFLGYGWLSQDTARLH